MAMDYCGLKDYDKALDVLKDESLYASAVRTDEALAQQIGVRGVPFFVLNNKYTISGAQAPETFLGALEKVWAEENAQPILQDLSENPDAACTDDGCDIPTNK